MSEIEGRLPRSTLTLLCRNEAVLKWMNTCDHLMYQALVEILIPDVLRPIPSESQKTHIITDHHDTPCYKTDSSLILIG